MKKIKEEEGTQDQKLKEELIKFAAENKIEKPETGVVVVLKPTVVKKSSAKPTLKKSFTLSHGIDKVDPEEKVFPVEKQKSQSVVEESPPKEEKPRVVYKPETVKLFLSKIEFVHKNRFKAGWQHLFKFMKKVRTDDGADLRIELIKFAAENKIEKPETGVVVVKKPIVVKKGKGKGKGMKRPGLLLSHGIDKVDPEEKVFPVEEQKKVESPVVKSTPKASKYTAQ
jgi:hypothetical protein